MQVDWANTFYLCSSICTTTKYILFIETTDHLLKFKAKCKTLTGMKPLLINFKLSLSWGIPSVMKPLSQEKSGQKSRGWKIWFTSHKATVQTIRKISVSLVCLRWAILFPISSEVNQCFSHSFTSQGRQEMSGKGQKVSNTEKNQRKTMGKM